MLSVARQGSADWGGGIERKGVTDLLEGSPRGIDEMLGVGGRVHEWGMRGGGGWGKRRGGGR